MIGPVGRHVKANCLARERACNIVPAELPRSFGKLRMQQTIAAASKKTTAAEPQRAIMARSQNGIRTMPFAAAQTPKYPMKCTRHPRVAMNLHPYPPNK